MSEMSIREFVEKFEAGAFVSRDRKTQCDAGWYDWFCNDTSLAAKTQKLGNKVVQLSKSDKVNIDTMYVFFKNNCPMNGRLYDSFSFCDMKTGDVAFWVCPSNGHKSEKGESQVCSPENEFKEPVAKGSWKDIKVFFGV